MSHQHPFKHDYEVFESFQAGLISFDEANEMLKGFGREIANVNKNRFPLCLRLVDLKV